MPALKHPRPLTETLTNGLRVTLRHAPNLKRCAAALRVAVGSHDVPLAWPGLAHFLEHLLFLGTERFPASEGLMAYVQRHGGQLNARTSERTTDYFFELPAQAFVGGLERLSDMLAHPRMNTDDQLREREVLQAEFIAWSQDAQAQQQQTLFNGLSDAHSLRGFHAGNRDSLPVEQAEFQQALRDFYQRFYQTGQMTLSLVGSQSIDELRAMAETFAGAIAQGEAVPQQAPTPLMNTPQKSYQQAGERRLDLLFALEALPESSAEALAFLCHWFNSAKPGSLLADLREQGLADNLRAHALYQFAGQALLHIEFTLPANPASTGIAERLADWLGFFAQQDWHRLREEYATLLQRQQHVSGALQLARLDSEQRENELSEQGVIALKHILTQMGAVDNFTGTWQLPSPNPFLRTEASAANAGLIRGQTSAHRGLRTFAQDRSRSRRERSPMQFSQALDTADEGAVYVRWRLAFAPGAHLQAALEHSLQPLREDALQAGVEMAFSASANEWLLKLTGLQEPMPRVLEHALKALTTVDSTFLQAPATAPALIPIRQLLKVLPDRCIENAAESEDLQQLWSTAHWSGLAVGFSTQTQAAMGLALSRIPGTAQTEPAPVTSIPSQHWWTHIDTGSSEHALLLFCPASGPELADEAAWRLLAHVCQTPFYQRLRVELQLGYAVFSGLRQMHGQTGLLFGVQSPSTEPKALLQHIEQFLHALPDLINAMDDSTFNGRRQALAEQFSPATLSTTQAAELLWQSTLAGRPSDYLTQLPTEILRIERAALLDSLSRLTRADGGWRCLASSANPGMPWQASR